MLKVRPFKALRPTPEVAAELSSLPYDVMNVAEAAQMAEGKPNSFLHIIRSEIDLPSSVDVHSKPVYEKARDNLRDFIDRGILKQDEKAHFYIYSQTMNARTQTGICALTSVDDYKEDKIKRHEFTLPEKETDRINNFRACNAHTEPVFFINKKNDKLSTLIKDYITKNDAVYDFVSEDGIAHKFWVICDSMNEEIEGIFADMDALYIADGHHRTNSSCRVGDILKGKGLHCEELDYIMAVIFSEDELFVMDYNRLLKDISDLSKEDFLKKLEEDFEVTLKDELYKADEKHSFSMYIDGEWYCLKAKVGSFDEEDPVARLDAAILQDNVFEKIFGIVDPRTSDRLNFVGGIRGYEELKKRVDNKEARVAFGVYSVTIEDLLKVADAEMIMPPKSTWFEPKLRSGLFIHQFFDEI